MYIHHQVAKWQSLTVWRCDRGAEVVFGGRLQFHDFVALDNKNAGMEMVKVSGGYGEDDGPGQLHSRESHLYTFSCEFVNDWQE